MRIFAFLAVALACGLLPALPARSADAARYTPAGWPFDLALPSTGSVGTPGGAAWTADDTGEFVWEIPGADAGEEIMLYRVSGSRLPADTPAPDKLADQQVLDLLTAVATANSHGLDATLADTPQPVAAGNRVWVRAQFIYGGELLNRNGIVYLTYEAGRYYALAAEYQFVIDAGFVDAESTTSVDAEDAFRAMID
jgi:hypothetical protein